MNSDLVALELLDVIDILNSDQNTQQLNINKATVKLYDIVHDLIQKEIVVTDATV